MCLQTDRVIPVYPPNFVAGGGGGVYNHSTDICESRETYNLNISLVNSQSQLSFEKAFNNWLCKSFGLDFGHLCYKSYFYHRGKGQGHKTTDLKINVTRLH